MNLNKIVRTVTAGFVFAAITSAQTDSNPGLALNSWNAITWGTTVQDARQALGDAATDPSQPPGPNDIRITRLVLKSVSVGPFTAIASLQSARGSDTITGASLRFGEMEDQPGNRSTTYTELKRLLIQKYEQPKDEHSRPVDGSTDRQAVWLFPQTTITLRWFEHQRYSIGFVTLEYRAVDRKALDIL